MHRKQMACALFLLTLVGCPAFSWSQASVSLTNTKQASKLTLNERFQEAEIGDFAVISHQKFLTLMRIVSKEGEKLTIEEISFPYSKKPKDNNWRQWLISGAPHHTSWLHTEIYLVDSHVSQVLSLMQGEMLDPSSADQILATLLKISFESISQEERKRVGAPPSAGESDRRSLWNPVIVLEGKVLAHAKTEAWKGRWPKDGSDLSDKLIEIYLPEKKAAPFALSYFPYWIDIIGKVGKGHLRVIDSGKGLRH